MSGNPLARVQVSTDEPALARGAQAILGAVAEVACLVGLPEAERGENLAAAGASILLTDFRPEQGLDHILEAGRRLPKLKIILWISHITAQAASLAIHAGIHGIIRRTASEESLRECILRVAAGERWFEPSLTAQIQDAPPARLSGRESQLIGLLVQGMKNREMAEKLRLSEKTVKAYIARLQQKLQARNRFDLALYGLQQMHPSVPIDRAVATAAVSSETRMNPLAAAAATREATL